jgi:uncharacterized protein
MAENTQAQLEALVRLQHFDTLIDQNNRLRGDLPEEIKDLEEERADSLAKIEKFNTEKKESDLEQRRSEMEKIESESLIERYQKQQTQVRNNREYDALSKEIENQKMRIREANERIEQMRLRDESNVAAQKFIDTRLTDLETLIAEKQAELNNVLDDTRQEREQLESKRESVTSAVEERYLNAYMRLRNRLSDGRAIVPVVAGAAAGYAVPPQKQLDIRQRNQLIFCEHSGRILVDEALFVEQSN